MTKVDKKNKKKLKQYLKTTDKKSVYLKQNSNSVRDIRNESSTNK
jgi:hypothetical protein